MVLAKVGAAGSAAMASISARWRAERLVEGRAEMLRLDVANGGRPNGPVQSASRGFSPEAAADEVRFMLRFMAVYLGFMDLIRQPD